MYLFKRKHNGSAFAMQDDTGQSIPFHLSFNNGEIHINPHRMHRGTYFLTMIEGKRKLQRKFVVE